VTREAFFTNANDPEGTVQFAITPRYLAGGGDPRRVTEVLRAAGWSDHSDPGYPHVLLASPDMAVRLTLEPAQPDTYTDWWAFHGPGWYVHFGGHTPTEILAGFSDALVRPAPEQAPSAAGIRDLLVATGWSREYDRSGTESARSPDGYLTMTGKPWSSDRTQRTWIAEASLPTAGGGHERMWQARFHQDTPSHLVAGFASALVDPGAVHRGSYGLPHSWLLTQEPTTVQGEQLAAEHRQRLEAVRAAARKQRRAAAALATRAPIPPGTASAAAPARR
jgi:hypothetical protein